MSRKRYKYHNPNRIVKKDGRNTSIWQKSYGWWTLINYKGNIATLTLEIKNIEGYLFIAFKENM